MARYRIYLTFEDKPETLLTTEEAGNELEARLLGERHYLRTHDRGENRFGRLAFRVEAA